MAFQWIPWRESMENLYVFVCVCVHGIMWLYDSNVLGNSLSLCLQFYCMFQVLLLIRARARLDGATCIPPVSSHLVCVLWILKWYGYVMWFLDILWLIFMKLKAEIFCKNLGCFKLVSNAWFEGFRHTSECVRTQTKEMVTNFFSKKKKLNFLKTIL